MYTGQDDQQVMAEFRQRRTRQLIVCVPVIAAIIPLVMLEDAGPAGLWGIPTSVVGAVCIAVIVAVLVYSLVNWRCPACNKYLGKGINPRYCRNCGTQLRP